MNTEQKMLIEKLIVLNEVRNGTPKTPHEIRLISDWVQSECDLRWKINIGNFVEEYYGK